MPETAAPRPAYPTLRFERRLWSAGAEVVCAADNSCLMQIGGALSRQRTGVRAVHLAEVLAS